MDDFITRDACISVLLKLLLYIDEFAKLVLIKLLSEKLVLIMDILSRKLDSRFEFLKFVFSIIEFRKLEFATIVFAKLVLVKFEF